MKLLPAKIEEKSFLRHFDIIFMKETWKPVPGYEGLYEVSDLGRVKGLKRGKIRKLNKSKNGYLLIILCKDGKTKGYPVHRLVYSAFNGEIPEGFEVNHIKEDKTNNRLCNLNLMTSKENTNWGTGIQRRAKSHSKAIIAFDKDENFVREFTSLVEASEWLGKPEAHKAICSCLKGRRLSAYGYVWKYKSSK